MKVFVNELEFTLVPLTNLIDSKTYTLVFKPDQKLVELQGEVLVLQPSLETLRTLIQKVKGAAYPNLLKLTVAVDDYPAAIALFKSQYHMIEAAGGVVEKDKKVLMIFRLGKWDLPKGKIEQGESVEEGAVREVEEECGVEVELNELVISTWHTYHHKGKDMLKKTYWYHMDCSNDEEMQPQQEEGIEQVAWLKPKEVEIARQNTYKSIEFVLDTWAE